MRKKQIQNVREIDISLLNQAAKLYKESLLKRVSTLDAKLIDFSTLPPTEQESLFLLLKPHYESLRISKQKQESKQMQVLQALRSLRHQHHIKQQHRRKSQKTSQNSQTDQFDFSISEVFGFLTRQGKTTGSDSSASVSYITVNRVVDALLRNRIIYISKGFVSDPRIKGNEEKRYSLVSDMRSGANYAGKLFPPSINTKRKELNLPQDYRYDAMDDVSAKTHFDKLSGKEEKEYRKNELATVSELIGGIDRLHEFLKEPI